MSPVFMHDGGVSARFPRVSGDEPTGDGGHVELIGFSPRERG